MKAKCQKPGKPGLDHNRLKANTMETLDKRHNSRLFKGETWKFLADRILDYFMPKFWNPILFVPSTDNLFDKGEVRYGEGDLPAFANNTCPGTYYLSVNEGRRRFKTILPDDVVAYLKSQIKPQL